MLTLLGAGFFGLKIGSTRLIEVAIFSHLFSVSKPHYSTQGKKSPNFFISAKPRLVVQVNSTKFKVEAKHRTILCYASEAALTQFVFHLVLC